MKKGQVVLNKSTGELVTLESFFHLDNPFWRSMKLTPSVYSVMTAKYLENKSIDKASQKKIDKHELYMNENKYFLHEDHVYSCPCKKADPMIAFWVDAENCFEDEWARANGVDLDQLVVCKPRAGEHAIDQILHVMSESEFDLVVIDSLANLIPIETLKKSAEDPEMRY